MMHRPECSKVRGDQLPGHHAGAILERKVAPKGMLAVRAGRRTGAHDVTEVRVSDGEATKFRPGDGVASMPMPETDVRIPPLRARHVRSGGPISRVGWTVVDGQLVYKDGERVRVATYVERENGWTMLRFLRTPFHRRSSTHALAVNEPSLDRALSAGTIDVRPAVRRHRLP